MPRRGRSNTIARRYKGRLDTFRADHVHSNIGDGFHDVTLFERLEDIFNTLTSKSSLFVAGAASNANESLNAMIVSKAPKTKLYGKSAAGDIRVACAVNKKNSGKKYCIDVAKKLSISPVRYSKKYIEKVDSFSHRRYEKSSTRIEKLKRISLKKAITELKNKNEARHYI